jgi:hypothetical protein
MRRKHLAAIKERFMRLRLVLLVLTAAGVLTAGGVAEAQVRFSIGGSGWSVGNSSYGYGYGNGYGGYGYGHHHHPQYYNPPVIRHHYYYDDDYDYDDAPRVIPQATYRPTYIPLQPYSGPGVTVRNPAGSKVQLAYLLDDSREQEISAGETQKLTEKGSYVVSFDRGGDHGTARYTITEGLYEFTMTDHGWELYRQKTPAEKQADPKVKANPLPEARQPEPADPELPKALDAEGEKGKET